MGLAFFKDDPLGYLDDHGQVIGNRRKTVSELLLVAADQDCAHPTRKLCMICSTLATLPNGNGFFPVTQLQPNNTAKLCQIN